MSEIPANLKDTRDHEWVRLEDDGLVTLGITDHAQQALGELVYVELPEIEQQLTPGDACAVVESVKAASDVYAPVAGSITAINEDLADDPEKINADPYGDGWIVRIDASDFDEGDLMTPDAYQELLDQLDD